MLSRGLTKLNFRHEYNTLHHLQRRNIFDMIFLKTFGGALLNRIAVEYAYNKYLGYFRYFTSWFKRERVYHEEISHYATPLIKRSNQKLVTLDDSILKLKHQYNIISYIVNKENQNEKENNDITLILNLGKKRVGKSLISTISSIMLSNDGGCIFPINLNKSNDLQTTFGCDISPPLTLNKMKYYKDIESIKYLSFIDFEGIDNNNNNEDMIQFIKDAFLDKYPCIVILSSLLTFEENDVNLLQKLYENNDINKNPLILALNSSNIEDIEYSSNYLKIVNDIGINVDNDNFRLCQLPFFEESRKDEARKYRKEMMNEITNTTPLKYMTHKEKTQYFNLCIKILQIMSQSNKNDVNYLGINSQEMIDILKNIEISTGITENIRMGDKLY